MLLNLYLMKNMKKPIEIPVSLFFHNIGPTLVQCKFCPKDHIHFIFLANFQWNMLADTTDINDLC